MLLQFVKIFLRGISDSFVDDESWSSDSRKSLTQLKHDSIVDASNMRSA